MRTKKRTKVMILVIISIMVATGVSAKATNKEDKARYYLKSYIEKNLPRVDAKEKREELVEMIFEIEDRQIRDEIFKELEESEIEKERKEKEIWANYVIASYEKSTNDKDREAMGGTMLEAISQIEDKDQREEMLNRVEEYNLKNKVVKKEGGEGVEKTKGNKELDLTGFEREKPKRIKELDLTGFEREVTKGKLYTLYFIDLLILVGVVITYRQKNRMGKY